MKPTRTYFITTLRVNVLNKREWFVSEITKRNPFYYIHKMLGMIYGSYDAAEDAIVLKIKKEGGRYVKELPKIGPPPGNRKGSRRGKYKPTHKTGRYLKC